MTTTTIMMTRNVVGNFLTGWDKGRLLFQLKGVKHIRPEVMYFGAFLGAFFHPDGGMHSSMSPSGYA